MTEFTIEYIRKLQQRLAVAVKSDGISEYLREILMNGNFRCAAILTKLEMDISHREDEDQRYIEFYEEALAQLEL